MNTKKIFGYGARSFLCAFAVMFALAFAACDDGTDSGGGVNEGYSNGISLDRYSLSLTVGQSSVLTATVLPDTASQNLVWVSNNPNIAAVVNGTVTGVSAGTAEIMVMSAEDPSKTATCNVTVTGGPGPQLSPEMVYVPGGSFQMGNSDSSFDDFIDYEQPVHTVTLSSFYMGKYEVTQGLYETVMGYNPPFIYGFPERFIGSNLPVAGRVSWYDAVEFCNRLSAREGLQPVYTISGRTPATGYPITFAEVTADWGRDGYRLPTEAEWEYAAKGGDGSPGNYLYAGSDNRSDVAWWGGDGNRDIHEVGTKAPNGLGLYDMSGNVWEWCWDWFGYYPGGAQTDPTGPSSGTERVDRGGDYYNMGYHRNASRHRFLPNPQYATGGFRLARSAQ